MPWEIIKIKNSAMEIKFLDLKAQYPLIKDEILKKFDEIIENSAFISGKYTQQFEEEFAKYLGVKYCVAVNDGTSALYLALLAKGIGFGDEVLVPVNTFIATAEAVSLTGARPVFIDINEGTYNIDISKIEEKITDKTKAIIPVHLYGQCADMDPILEIAKKYKLIVIEDACQAHGAEYKGRKAGSMGDCGAFSFYPGKNLGTWGEGGAVVTNNSELAGKIMLLRNHGSKVKYQHDIVGGNFRMSEFEGAVLSTKIRYLDKWNEGRRGNAEVYLKLLAGKKAIALPVASAENVPVWHLFVVRTVTRDKFTEFLRGNSIQTGIHYPIPLHLCEAYSHLGYKLGDFPIAERVCKEIVSLPMYPELSEEEIRYVADTINEFLQ